MVKRTKIVSIIFPLLVGVYIVTVLSLYFTRHKYNGPNGNEDIDVGKEWNLLSNITTKSKNLSAFGIRVVAHNTGQVAIFSRDFNTGTVLQFYKLSAGKLIPSGSGDFNYKSQSYGEFAIGDAAFSSWLNLKGEIYYFFVGRGYSFKDPQSTRSYVACAGVDIYQFDSSKNDSKWTKVNNETDLSDINTCDIRHPGILQNGSKFQWDPSVNNISGVTGAARGSFGGRIRVVKNEFSTSDTSHFIYIHGSMWDITRPGGAVHWYEILSNKINPTINFVLSIKDSNLTDTTIVESSVLNDRWYKYQYQNVNGFGSDFDIGINLGVKNIMAIGNPSNIRAVSLDPTNGEKKKPEYPGGYVNVYRIQAPEGVTTISDSVFWSQSSKEILGLGLKNVEGFGSMVHITSTQSSIIMGFYNTLWMAKRSKSDFNSFNQGLVPLFPLTESGGVKPFFDTAFKRSGEIIEISDGSLFQFPQSSKGDVFAKTLLINTELKKDPIQKEVYTFNNSDLNSGPVLNGNLIPAYAGEGSGFWVSRTKKSQFLAFGNPSFLSGGGTIANGRVMLFGRRP
jgi:hypothetical protein